MFLIHFSRNMNSLSLKSSFEFRFNIQEAPASPSVFASASVAASVAASVTSAPVASEDAEGNLIVREEIYANLERTTGLPRGDILFAHATDRYHVDEHCPDFAVVLLHNLKQVGDRT